MDYFEEYYDKKLCGAIVDEICKQSEGKKFVFMEVCGTHTVSIFRNGIKSLLPENIKLISGPGCPVCVTPNSEIDKAIEISKTENTSLFTFGDMMKVPGSRSSLEKEKSKGRDIQVVYTPTDAVKAAEGNKKRKVVFFSIGFETTTPTIAASVKDAKEKKLKNYFIVAANKLIPPAIKAILQAKEIKIDGFILPGHVSTIIGAKAYEFIPKDYGVPCTIAGFEPVDILYAILHLIKQIKENSPSVENCYKRSVRTNGNPLAIKLINEVFETCDAEWRGLGKIPDSGLKLSEEFSEYDAEKNMDIKLPPPIENPACICGNILRGVNLPTDCKLFGKVCNPENPVGPCMVSSEGTCAAYYKYGTEN